MTPPDPITQQAEAVADAISAQRVNLRARDFDDVYNPGKVAELVEAALTAAHQAGRDSVAAPKHVYIVRLPSHYEPRVFLERDRAEAYKVEIDNSTEFLNMGYSCTVVEFGVSQ